MFKRYRSAAVAVTALLATSSLVWAAGNYSTYPIVGGASFCASTVSGAGGFNTDGNVGGGGATGQGQASSGSLCAQTVPAGPTILTGSELVPADTQIGSGANPQTVTIPMASLNALPLTVSAVPTSTTTTLSATNLTGGYVLTATGTITAATISLPSAPIDGQQFAISSNRTITTLSVTDNTAGHAVASAPTVLTLSTTAPMGYRFLYNAAALTWYRVQ